MEPVTEAATVTGAPPTRSAASPQTLRWSQEHWLLQAQWNFQEQGPSLPHERPQGPSPSTTIFSSP